MIPTLLNPPLAPSSPVIQAVGERPPAGLVELVLERQQPTDKKLNEFALTPQAWLGTRSIANEVWLVDQQIEQAAQEIAKLQGIHAKLRKKAEKIYKGLPALQKEMEDAVAEAADAQHALGQATVAVNHYEQLRDETWLVEGLDDEPLADVYGSRLTDARAKRLEADQRFEKAAERSRTAQRIHAEQFDKIKKRYAPIRERQEHCNKEVRRIRQTIENLRAQREVHVANLGPFWADCKKALDARAEQKAFDDRVRKEVARQVKKLATANAG